MDRVHQWQMEKSPQTDAPHCEHFLQWTLTHSRRRLTLPNYLGRYASQHVSLMVWRGAQVHARSWCGPVGWFIDIAIEPCEFLLRLFLSGMLIT